MAASKKAVAGIAAAWALCFAPALQGVARQCWDDPDMGHALLVPPVMAWIVWRERAWLHGDGSAAPGWVLLVLGAALNAAGCIGAGLFAQALGAWVSAAGAVAALGGAGLVWELRFPLALGGFLLPKLGLLYNAAAAPLQSLASRVAALALTGCGMAVVRDGNVLTVGGRSVEVETACSGLRYLLPLLFLAAVWGWQSGARTWVRWTLLAAVPPIALAANAARVALTAAFAPLASGWRHDLLGWALFVLCLGVIGSVERGLRHA